MNEGNKGKGQSQELHFGNKVKLEEIGQRTVIYNSSMTGEKRSQCFLKKEKERRGEYQPTTRSTKMGNVKEGEDFCKENVR